MCAWALRGTVPALAGNVGTGGAFALAREGNYRESTFLRSLRPGPAPLDVFWGGSAVLGSVPHMCHMWDRPLKDTETPRDTGRAGLVRSERRNVHILIPLARQRESSTCPNVPCERRTEPAEPPTKYVKRSGTGPERA